MTAQLTEEQIATCNNCGCVITDKDHYADLCQNCEFIDTDED